MVTIFTAYTAPINPAGAEPVLTTAQVWAGLQRKIRHAEEFVPPITACKVVSESGNEVVRDATFAAGHIAGRGEKVVREVCRSWGEMKVDFHQPDGSLITNMLSHGPSLEQNDLMLSYQFEWRHPDVEEGSWRAMELMTSHTKGAKMAVDSSIETIRRMVKEGTL